MPRSYVPGAVMLLLLMSCSYATGQARVSLPLQRFRVTSPYGYRIHPITGKRQFHSGADFAAQRPQPVKSILDGVVLQAGYDALMGNYVRVAHGEGVSSLYGHLSLVLVSRGEGIQSGQVIGISGDSGMVTGRHLHFGVCYRGGWVDPVRFLSDLLRVTHAGH